MTVGPHPVLACVTSLSQALQDVAGVPVEFMSVADKAAALTQLAQTVSRMESLRLRLLACADDVAKDAGARDIAAWVAAATHTEASGERRTLRLATALDARWPTLGQALAEARVNPDQAHVIAGALDALPDHVDREILLAAEAQLIQDAAHFGPRELRVLGRRILDIVAPEVAEEHERKLLEDEVVAAEAATSLTRHLVRPGLSRFEIRVPTPTADRLISYLEAFTSPRQRGTHDHPDQAGESVGVSEEAGAHSEAIVPRAQQLGRAFCAFVESYDPHRLPLHGGDATTVIVNIDFETLRDDVAAATHSTATFATAAGTGGTGGSPEPTTEPTTSRTWAPSGPRPRASRPTAPTDT